MELERPVLSQPCTASTPSTLSTETTHACGLVQAPYTDHLARV